MKCYSVYCDRVFLEMPTKRNVGVELGINGVMNVNIQSARQYLYKAHIV